MEHLVNVWRRSKYWFCDHDLCLIRSYSIVTDTFAPAGPTVILDIRANWCGFLTMMRFIIRQIYTHLYITPSMNQMANNKQQRNQQEKKKLSAITSACWTMKNWGRARERETERRRKGMGTSFANRRIKIPIVFSIHLYVFIFF